MTRRMSVDECATTQAQVCVSKYVRCECGPGIVWCVGCAGACCIAYGPVLWPCGLCLHTAGPQASPTMHFSRHSQPSSTQPGGQTITFARTPAFANHKFDRIHCFYRSQHGSIPTRCSIIGIANTRVAEYIGFCVASHLLACKSNLRDIHLRNPHAHTSRTTAAISSSVVAGPKAPASGPNGSPCSSATRGTQTVAHALAHGL